MIAIGSETEIAVYIFYNKNRFLNIKAKSIHQSIRHQLLTLLGLLLLVDYIIELQLVMMIKL